MAQVGWGWWHGGGRTGDKSETALWNDSAGGEPGISLTNSCERLPGCISAARKDELPPLQQLTKMLIL